MLDNAGNLSAFTMTEKFTPNIMQETATKLTYSSGWTRGGLSGASGGKVKYATVSGKTASVQVHRQAVRLGEHPRAEARCGQDRVWTAVPPTTVNTNASSLTEAYLVYAGGSAANTKHTITLTVNGTAGHPRVDVDAFVWMTVP